MDGAFAEEDEEDEEGEENDKSKKAPLWEGPNSVLAHHNMYNIIYTELTCGTNPNG